MLKERVLFSVLLGPFSPALSNRRELTVYFLSSLVAT